MSANHDRVVHAARKAGAHAAKRHAAGEHVTAPDPLAGSLLARKAATAWHAGFAEMRAVSHPESKAASGYDGLTKQSGMISLDLPDGTVEAPPGGVDDSHVTVIFLGDALTPEDFDQACDRAQEAASRVPGPMTVSLSGIAAFPPNENGKKAVYVPASVPGGDRLHDDLSDLSASQFKTWVPHATSHFDDGDAPLPAPHPPKVVTVSHLSVHRGDEVRRFPFGGATQGEKDMTALMGMERKVGPKGYEHGWRFVGVPGTGGTVHHPKHGKGTVTSVTDTHVGVRFNSGAEHTFERGKPRTGKAGRTAVSPASSHAASARLLAADVRKSPVRSTLTSGRHYDTREMAASHLDKAAEHFDSGRNSEALQEVSHARTTLADRASQGRTAVKPGGLAGERLRLADRSTDPTPEHAEAFRTESADHSARATALYHAATAETGASSRTRAQAVQHAKAVRAADLKEGGGEHPPLAIVHSERQGDGSHLTEAVDHEGRDFSLKFGTDKSVTVTHEGRSSTAPGGANPTQTARELAGKLTGQEAGKPSPGAPMPHHAATAHALADDVRLERGLNGFQREEAATRLRSAGRNLSTGNHGDAVTDLDDATRAAGTPGGGVIAGSVAARSRNLATQVRADTGTTAAPEHSGDDKWWADSMPAAKPDPKPAPKQSFDQGGLFAQPDKLGTAPMFGDQFGTSGITNPNPEAAPPVDAAALHGDAAYGHVAEPSGKLERDAANYYTSGGSGRFNQALRSGSNLTDKTDQAQLRSLGSAFAKSPPTTSHITAYRGTVGSLFGEGDATGTEFTDKGFSSVSTDPEQAVQFGPEKGSALMEIHVPAGSKVVKPGTAGQYSTGDDAEKELVLNRGSRYEITGDQMINHPKYGRIRKLTATYKGSA